ncbi:hypothetical protein LTR78_004750 [Recurvomyces mirabilis]|uniref:Uncharacterized protein n=1 Tax=Recurvomyces mirabilis TaxID=574656 RepID=A0AAE0WNT6_9PEZI|nr:hypothetical protein LTR78_004750 [Recurvomyces mirabilis]KAK5157921.1 hypothetical protein LTS14_003844 [Recurvomyces mirabilis]
MSPIRRYLRITKYSVLEVRIYLEKPSDAPWLLSSRDSVLARVIEEVRPLVLPKLREENENAKKKSSKKRRGIKDVVTAEDFEVAIFLTELSTRHSLLTKHKHFSDKPKLKSTGNKLTGWLNNSGNPINIDEEEKAPEILLEEEEEDVPELSEIPEVQSSKRKSNETGDDEPLFVSSDDEDFFTTQRERTGKRRKRHAEPEEESVEEPLEQVQDDKKKLAMNTSYDGFSIYGRILCLLVKRKGKKAQPASTVVGGSQMMEQWVSTQAAQEAGLDDDDDG